VLRVVHYRLSFDNAIHEELVADLEKSAVYASSRLHRFSITPDRRAADIECADGAQEEVTSKVKKLVGAMARTFRSLGEPEELARTTRRDEHAIMPAAEAFAELVRRRWALSLGTGQVGLAGGAYALKRFLDDAVRDLARAQFGAREEDHPALLEPDVLVRCGYFTSFPHSVCLVSHLTEDFDAIEAFRAANTDTGELCVPDASAMNQSDAALRPAVCLPVYRALQGTEVPEGGLAITTAGKCFRYESRNLQGMQRLWDFSMREIVFIGDADFVEEQRARVVGAATALMEAWDLSYRLVSATDPFFATVRGSKALFQRTRALKHEMMIDVGAGGGGEIAAGSINVAGELFGNAFDIRAAGGKTATTACVGFGLERLVLALFAQHGFTPARWPRALQEVVFG
jgi:seryl-tRNA synthetase